MTYVPFMVISSPRVIYRKSRLNTNITELARFARSLVMAEKDTLQKLQDQLQCTICLDTYTDPKVLQCDHVYCRECLRQLLLRNMSGDHSLTCPSCRQVTPVPENGVQGLKPAFQINSFLEIKKSLEKKVVNTPEVPQGQLQDPEASDQKVTNCQDHVKEEFKLYCETCKKLICLYCVIKGAKHHKCDYERLPIVCDRYKGEIETSLRPVKQNLATIEEALKVFEKSRGDISDQRAVVEANINSTIDQLQGILEDRRNKLVTQLHQLTERKLACLDTQHESVKVIQEILQHCQGNVEGKLKTMSSHELVEAKKSLIDQINGSISVFQPGVLSPTTTADIKLSSSMNTMKVCQDYGILSAKETLPDLSKFRTTGSGLDTVMVGETAKVVVQAVDHWGEPCDVPDRALGCNIVSAIKNVPKIITPKRTKKGHYELCFVPTLKGYHYLQITINNQHIRGSPFVLLAKSSARLGEKMVSTIYSDNPCGIVINHKREIVVAEKHWILVYSQGGIKLRTFGIRGINEGEFNNPRGIAVDEDDNILVADYKNNRIQKFTSDGEFLAAVGTKGNKPLQFKGPKAIAFNTFNKKVYVGDKNRVQILNSDLTYCGAFREDINSTGIGCDRSGRVYLSQGPGGQIMVFSADGDFLSVIGKISALCNSEDVAIDDDNNVFYMSNIAKGQVSAFTLEGDALYSFSIGKLSGLRGLAVDGGVLYVCDNIFNCVRIY